MKKRHPSYLCRECGARFSRWQGSCHSCGAWDSIGHSPTSASNLDFGKLANRERESLLERGSPKSVPKSSPKSIPKSSPKSSSKSTHKASSPKASSKPRQPFGDTAGDTFGDTSGDTSGGTFGDSFGDAGESLLRPLGSATAALSRIATGIDEFDRALGGGLVRGSVLLLGGDPGVGKSTLALQVAVSLSDRISASASASSAPNSSLGSAAIYVSGEEDRAQLALRARRLSGASEQTSPTSPTSPRPASAPRRPRPPTSAAPTSPPASTPPTPESTDFASLSYGRLLCSSCTEIDFLLRHLLELQERALSEGSSGYALLVVDSIQTMRSLGSLSWDSRYEGSEESFGDRISGYSSAGSLSSLRILTESLTHFARRTGITVLLIGHVTKEGQLAGPKQIEHMVDTVLYLEGERGHGFRLLRAVKNRFGSLDELGVFEMRSRGLCGVANPSSLFLSSRSSDAPGTAVFASVEGTRPFLCEVQALVSSAPPGSPRRTALGWDSMRLATLLAVLEAHANLRLGSYEVYLNISGGLRVRETACDLAVACAIVSAARKISIPRGWVFCGEIGLTGDVRAVGQTRMRAAEASKLGFTNMLLSSSGAGSDKLRDESGSMSFDGDSDFSFQRIGRVSEIVKWLNNATVAN